MSDTENWNMRRMRWINRIVARLSRFARPATGFVTPPEPRSLGQIARGRQLCAGNFLFAGHLVETTSEDIWDLPRPSAAYEVELHRFDWLDDLAALGDAAAVDRARRWTHEWIARFGRGDGPGWAPDLVGRRVMLWIDHGVMLLQGADAETTQRFFRALSQQVAYLARRWRSTTVGLHRFEALSGVIFASMALGRMERRISAGITALGVECARSIDEEGAIASRNPEEQMEVFTLLAGTADALREAGRMPAPQHLEALERMAPLLRALRHQDGGLVRFHGGGRGATGQLDRALAYAGIPAAPLRGQAMGYARLSHGRTSLIVDAAAPPPVAASANAHASTLAFELTSGRRPLIVNCGSGRSFGESWHRAGRATASHSTVSIDGYSSSRLGMMNVTAGQSSELLVDAPRDVRIEWRHSDLSTGFIAGHDGYVVTHGLTHVRQVHLGYDGRSVQGEDVLATIERSDEAIFDRALGRTGLDGIPFRVRFHLYPDVEARLDPAGRVVSLILRSGERWVFRHGGAAELLLEPSVYLEKGRLAPRATKQIVLSSSAVEYATRVSWTLAKAHDTPDVVRDHEYGAVPALT